jgi:hypothetical protein
MSMFVTRDATTHMLYTFGGEFLIVCVHMDLKNNI